MRKVEINKRYRHFNGKTYKVLMLAKDSETEKDLVIYQAEYGDNIVWARPIDMFLSKVDKEKCPNVKEEYRFTLIDD